MSRRALFASLAFCWSCSSSDVFVPLPPLEAGARALIFVFETPEATELHAFAIEPNTRLVVPFLAEAGARITALAYRRPLGDFALAPGPIAPATREPSRGLPIPVESYTAEVADGSASPWTTLDPQDAVGSHRIEAIDWIECISGGGCRSGEFCVRPCAPSRRHEPDPPASPVPPALPRLEPCPPGWSAVASSSFPSLNLCRPPERVLSCPSGQVQPPSSPSCAELGPPCPTGQWPEGLPAGTPVLYVRADAPAGGTGSITEPYQTLAEAITRATPGTIVALAKGTHAASLELPNQIELRGACAAETMLTGALGAPALYSFGEVSLRGLTVTAPSWGFVAELGASVNFEGVIFRGDGADSIGFVAHPGAQVIARASAFFDHGDYSIVGEEGSRTEIFGSVFEHTTAAVLITGAGAQAIAGNVRIHDLLGDERIDGSAFIAGGGAEVRVSTAAISRARSAIAFADGVGTTLSFDRSHLADGFGQGRGLAVSRGASLSVRRSSIRRFFTEGVAITATSSGSLADVLIEDGLDARGLAISDSTASGARLAIGGAHEAALIVTEGSSAELADVSIADVYGAEAGRLEGHGIIVLRESALQLSKARIERAHSSAVLVDGSSFEVADLEIADTRSRESDQLFGFGMFIMQRGRLAASRLAIRGSRGAALAVRGSGSFARVEDVVIDRVEVEQGAANGFAHGLSLASTRAELARALIGGCDTAAVSIDGSLPSLLLESAVLESSKRGLNIVANAAEVDLDRVIIRDSSGRGLDAAVLSRLDITDFAVFGSLATREAGIFLSSGTDLVMRRFSITGHQDEGMLIDPSPTTDRGLLDIRDGEISGNGVGIRALRDRAAQELVDGVYYHDNDTHLDLGAR